MDRENLHVGDIIESEDKHPIWYEVTDLNPEANTVGAIEVPRIGFRADRLVRLEDWHIKRSLGRTFLGWRELHRGNR